MDICLLIYDDKARFIEKLDADNPQSSDKSCFLSADIDAHITQSYHEENCHVSFPLVQGNVSCMLLFIDGGPRNFQFVQNIVIHCWQENTDSSESDFMTAIDTNYTTKFPLFYTQYRCRKDFEGLNAFVLYRKDLEETFQWIGKPVYDPVYVSGNHEKDEHCSQLIVEVVPPFYKFRPRLFPSVKHICSALSSTSLPDLKTKFTKGKGLELKYFTEVLFYQLSLSNPKVLDPEESAYTVAMLHDLFGQIDFNGMYSLILLCK